MNDRYFEKVNEIREKVEKKEGDNEQHLEELNRQFSLLCDDFKLLTEEEKTPDAHNKVLNAEHVYHVVGVKLTEAMLDIEPLQNSIPCAQKEPEPVVQMEQDSSNAATEKTNQGSVDNTEKRLTYEQRRDVYDPLYRLRHMDSVNERSIHNVITAITTMGERAKKYNCELDPEIPAIVCYIHSILDNVSQSVWDFQLDQQEPDLDMMVQFLTKRARQIPNERGHKQEPPAKKSKPNQCAFCHGFHTLCKCQAFRTSKLVVKKKFVAENQLCESCFSPTHAAEMWLDKACKDCPGQKHNTLLCAKNRFNY